MKVTVSYTSMYDMDGLSFPLLLIDGIPEPMSAAYTVRLLASGVKLGTIDTIVWQIKVLYSFLQIQGIYFHKRMAALEGLSHTEVHAYSLYCSKCLKDGSKVKASTYKIRMIYSQKFIEYWFEYYQSRITSKTNKFNRATETKRMMLLSFSIAKASPINSGGDKIGLTPELKEKFFQIIDPESLDNPWAHKKVKWRNYVLLLLYILSGNRRGEQLLLEVDDFELEGPSPSFAIKHRVRPAYPRMMQPAVKTRGRIIHLSSTLCKILRFYLLEIRPTFKRSLQSSYMFLSSRDGGPLSLTTPNVILDSIKIKYPEFKDKISPHRLRNTFHDMLEEALNSSPLSESTLINQSKRQAIQTYAGGWSPTSDQPARYALGERMRNVNKLQKNIQSLELSRGDKNVE